MRTRRTSDKVGPRYLLKATFTNAGHGSASCNPFYTAYVGTESVMEDYNNAPAYKSKNVVMSPCRLTRSSRIAEENPIRSAEAENINGSLAKVTFSGDFAGYFAYSLPNQLEVDMGNANGTTLTEAYAKMHTSDTLAGEQIATMKQTIGMIRSPFKSMTKLAKRAQKRLRQRQAQIRKTYWRDRKRLRLIKAKPIQFQELAKAFAVDLQRAVASCWLELRYGMMPLMFDVESHIEYIQANLDTCAPTIRRVARSSQRIAQKNDSWEGPVGCGLDYVYEPRARAEWSLSRRVSAGVIYSVSPQSNISQLVGHLGLRVRDLPATAWELVPLSFVVDWAINIGDWLQAITPVPGIQPLSNWVTTVEDRKTTISGVSFYTYLGWFTNHKVSFDFPAGTEHQLLYERVVDNSLPSTPLLLGKPLSNTHLGDSAALTVTKFAKVISSIFK